MTAEPVLKNEVGLTANYGGWANTCCIAPSAAILLNQTKPSGLIHSFIDPFTQFRTLRQREFSSAIISTLETWLFFRTKSCKGFVDVTDVLLWLPW